MTFLRVGPSYREQLLKRIIEEPGLSAYRLAMALELETGSVSSILKRMADEGVVRREPGSGPSGGFAYYVGSVEMTKEARDQTKAEQELYRKAAERLSGGKTSNLVAVNYDADRTGAFVEVVVWVPMEEMRSQLTTEMERMLGPKEGTI